MLNPEKKNQHEELVGNIPSLKQKVKLVGYSNLKEKVLLVALRELENIIVKDESAYEIAEKENKRIGLSFAIMLIACCVFTYATYSNILPFWIANLCLVALMTLLIMWILYAKYKNKEL